MSNTLYDEVGGRPMIEKIHKTFYDELYKHPWLKTFFIGIEQERIEKQQTDFMGAQMGGPNVYVGISVKTSHTNLFVTKEMIITRAKLLKKCIIQHGVSEKNADRWLERERVFYNVIIKESVADCKEKYSGEKIVVVPKPSAY